MDVNDPVMRQAAELLEQHKYREALAAFAKIYEQCPDENEREAIFEKMYEEIYPPIIEELRENYERNLAILQQYPYFRGTLRGYEELPFQLFPASDKYNCFSKDGERLLGEYDAAADNKMRYFFENLDKPLFVENEDNLYNLNFLNDNVRASEDYAADNHIYLFYDTPEPLERLMLACDLEPVLRQKKFVFLIGEENKKHYPLDFKKEFEIDYTDCQPKELSVNDIKRIILGYKAAGFAGTSFLADVMDFHPDLLTIPDAVLWFWNIYTQQLKGKTLSEAISLWKQFPNERVQSTGGIMGLVRIDYVFNNTRHVPQSAREEFERASAEEFLGVLETVLAEFPRPNAREWLIGFFLAYARCHRRSFGRVIPALFLYPHENTNYLAGFSREIFDFYFDLAGSFPYHKVIALIRNPVTQTGAVANCFITQSVVSAAQNAQAKPKHFIFGDVATYSLFPNDFYFSSEHPLRDSMRVVRFEDLKLNPKAAFASMCEFLNIPITSSMFHTTWCGSTTNGVNTEGAVFEGFDPTPVYKSYDRYLSEFDKYRIELLLHNLIELYGYRPKYYDGKQFSDEEIIKMMERPFLFESLETALTPEEYRVYREEYMKYIKFSIDIKNFPFIIGEEQFAPLPWLRPKEELLERPLYPEE